MATLSVALWLCASLLFLAQRHKDTKSGVLVHNCLALKMPRTAGNRVQLNIFVSFVLFVVENTPGQPRYHERPPTYSNETMARPAEPWYSR